MDQNRYESPREQPRNARDPYRLTVTEVVLIVIGVPPAIIVLAAFLLPAVFS